jgi:hypothetical protein
MIQDHELSQLSNPETSIIASLGFVGVGGFIGLFGPFLSSVQRIIAVTHTPPDLPLTYVDIWYIFGFAGSTVLALVCLAISWSAWSANRSLSAKIRARPKHGLKAD